MRNLILTLIIWIICFTAITAGISLTYTWHKNRGQDIYIHFKDVEGLVPNTSKIMYLGVQIGHVSEIKFDIKTMLPVVKARVSQELVNILGPDSSFWIVHPELALAGIKNLGTIASGNYIGVNPIKGKFTQKFMGMDDAPTEQPLGAVLRLFLKANSATGLQIGSSILYRGLEIGQVEKMSLAQDKRSIMIQFNIQKEYKSVIRKNSYFGNVSGFHASIHLLSGSEINMNSFKTLVGGAIEIITPNLDASIVKDNHTFDLLTAEQLENIKTTINSYK